MSVKEETKFIFVTLSKRQCWGFFNRRNEAILWELSRRESVESVLHIEFISLRKLLSILRQWFKNQDSALKSALAIQFRKGLSLKPFATENDPKYQVFSVIELYSGKLALLKRFSDFIESVQYKAVNRFVEDSGSNVALIAYPPFRSLAEAIARIRHDILIADIVDDDVEMTEDNEKKKEFLESFEKVLPRCEWICSTSGKVAESYRKYANREIKPLPNGVDIAPYLSYKKGEGRKQKRRKVVGYVGVINKAMDTELLEHLLTNFPEVDFVLIGLYRDSQLSTIKRLTESFKNYHYLGERNFREVPGYLENFDVLINFKKDDYSTAGNDSMKIYQYLATGKPVVATPMSPAEKFSDIIYVAHDKNEFADYLAVALHENDVALRERRKAEAQRNSWAARVDVILENVSKIAEEKALFSTSGKAGIYQTPVNSANAIP
jgi:glycosyltransferase involved in cell wall biosynthesis